ncbi:MAG: hypothetical protein Q9218_003336 [Villophora microphyllina]
MSEDEVPHDVINPITALAAVRYPSNWALLVGEGPFLRIFDHGTAQILASCRVFETQAIHGIAVSDRPREDEDSHRVVQFLFWGGRWVCFGKLRHDVKEGSPGIEINLAQQIQVDGWVLDATFKHGVRAAEQDASIQKKANAVLVTAQNDAFAVHAGQKDRPTVRRVASGSRSMLYSAHIEWTHNGPILIASGTVFGEVLLWSFAESALASKSDLPTPTQLHHRYVGHEGSVFGVRISQPLPGSSRATSKRLLASCSDDRTIRVWDFDGNDIWETNSHKSNCASPSRKGDGRQVSTSRCVAMIMGHQSRIWNVRFLMSREGVAVISFGEDGTAQVWRLLNVLGSQGPMLPEERNSGSLAHHQAYAYHFGKNIWASAVFQGQNHSHMACTGGADGRVVAYDICQPLDAVKGGFLSRHWTMQDVAKQLEENQPVALNDAHSTQTWANDTTCFRIFAALEGRWDIKREISSALPTYPSGTFAGEAVIAGRILGGDKIDKEYLYTEHGTFTTDQGLSFPATRQYVYRFRRATDTMSAWFVKTDGSSAVDYLFHELQLDSATEADDADYPQGQMVVRATGYHLCVEDHYTPEYKFLLKHGSLQEWTLSYRVKGPQKDYHTEATFLKQNYNGNLVPANQVEKEIPVPKPTDHQGDYVISDEILEKDGFKSYICLSSGSFLTTTVRGKVLLGVLAPPGSNVDEAQLQTVVSPAAKWKLIGHFDVLKSSSIVARSVGSDYVFISGNDGTIYRYNSQEKVLHPVSIPDRKVAFLHCQKLHAQSSSSRNHVVLAVRLGLSVAHIYNVGTTLIGSDLQLQSRPLLIAFPESWVVTSAWFLEVLEVWVLGSRHGALSFYDAANFSIDTPSIPLDVRPDVHGSDAVTTIVPLPGGTTAPQATQFFLTAGRDGHYAIHTITAVRTMSRSARLTIWTVHRSAPPFGPNIEGATFDQQSHELILWGFRSKDFVVWNASKSMETMTIECGGAHRNWYYTPRNDGSDGGTFIWTKASVCHVQAQASSLHRVFQSGGHGREIRAMALSPVISHNAGSIRRHIATGSEDTAIRIWSYESDQSLRSGFKCLGTFTKHITGIQQLRWSGDGRLLFSAAGREEFFVWRVQPVPCLGLGAVCEALCPPVTDDGDLRIMDFALKEIDTDSYAQARTEWEYHIIIAYSDGSLRLYYYASTPFRKSFDLLQSGMYNSVNCLTQTAYLDPYICLFTCTAASDGHLAFWLFPDISTTEDPTHITFPFKERTPVPGMESGRDMSLQYPCCIPLHQSYIKSIFVVPTEIDGKYLIVSGGDDGALGITLVGFRPSTVEPQYERLLIPKAHAAAVNAVVYVGKGYSSARTNENHAYRHVLMSSGSDQKIKTWIITINYGPSRVLGLDVDMIGDRFTSVADVAALAVTRIGPRVRVFVAGVGMERLDEDALDGVLAEDEQKSERDSRGLDSEAAAREDEEKLDWPPVTATT